MADYPDSIVSLTNPGSTDKMNSPSHSDQHSDANDEIEAIETELGVDPAGGYDTVVARLNAVDANVSFTDPVFTGTATFNDAANANLINVINDGTGKGLFIDQNGAGIGLSVDNAGTNSAIRIDQGGILAAGDPALYVTASNAQVNAPLFRATLNHTDATSPVVEIIQEHAGSASQGLMIRNDGTGNGLLIDQNGNGVSLNIDSEATTAHVITLNNAGTGRGISLTQVGNGIGMVLGSSATTQDTALFSGVGTGACLALQQTSTGNGLFINMDGNGVALKIDNVGTSADIEMNATGGGIIFPTSDPNIAGAWWDNAGTLTKSSG